MRELTEADRAGLEELFDGLSEDDRYLRFFSGGRVPAHIVEEMAEEDPTGVRLVAEVDGRIVGEASCALLPDGDGELGITVARDWRGWLGAFLLDALREAAAARGMPNLEADILVANRAMLGLAHKRACAVMERPDWTIVRLILGTSTCTPTWPMHVDTAAPRVLVETPSGYWRHEEAARKAGMQVLACPGPGPDRTRCPALRGEACPLAAEADVVVALLPPAAAGEEVAAAHARLHGGVPVCVFADDAPHDDVVRELERQVSGRRAHGRR